MRKYLIIATLTSSLFCVRSADADEKEGSRRALLIGVNNYKLAPNLEFASTDAALLGKTLRESDYNVVFVVDTTCSMTPMIPATTATVSKIRSELKRFLNATQPEDVAIISFSGHGTVIADELGDELYLAGSDFDPLSPIRTGISVNEIRSAMDASKARRCLLFVDACRSELEPQPQRVGFEKGGVSEHNRGIERNPASDGAFWKSYDFAANAGKDLSRYPLWPIWCDPLIKSRDGPQHYGERHTGRTSILFSCSPGEKSYESVSEGQGLFTRYLVQGLAGAADNNRDRLIAADELWPYVSNRVAQHAKQCGVHQTPMFIKGNFVAAPHVPDAAALSGSDIVVAQVHDPDSVNENEAVSIRVSVIEKGPNGLPVDGASVCVIRRSKQGSDVILQRTLTTAMGDAFIDLRLSFSQCLDDRFVVIITHNKLTRECVLPPLQREQSFVVNWPASYSTIQFEACEQLAGEDGSSTLRERSIPMIERSRQERSGLFVTVVALIVGVPLAFILVLLLTLSFRYWEQLCVVSDQSQQSFRQQKLEGHKGSTQRHGHGRGMDYEVALSFAGEDREYAEDLANLLSDRGVRVFYDYYETAGLWGKDLYQHLQTVYRDRAAFCVVLISSAYAEKLWTRHELEQAQARAFREWREYILPLRVDDTEIPGINETVAYLDLRSTAMTTVAECVVEKLAGLT